jgi:hypothetical protein
VRQGASGATSYSLARGKASRASPLAPRMGRATPQLFMVRLCSLADLFGRPFGGRLPGLGLSPGNRCVCFGQFMGFFNSLLEIEGLLSLTPDRQDLRRLALSTLLEYLASFLDSLCEQFLASHGWFSYNLTFTQQLPGKAKTLQPQQQEGTRPNKRAGCDR